MVLQELLDRQGPSQAFPDKYAGLANDVLLQALGFLFHRELLASTTFTQPFVRTRPCKLEGAPGSTIPSLA